MSAMSISEAEERQVAWPRGGHLALAADRGSPAITAAAATASYGG
jgi:hypothetical protein